jgi:uncharacterized protein (TIGR03083 family)
MDIWPVIHAERRSLAADLRSLQDVQWSATSWSSEWTIRDVVAHMTSTAKMSPAAFFSNIAASGFRFERLQAKGIAANSGNTPADTLANFDAIVLSKGRPPGPPDTMLGEVIVHSQDIRGALAIPHDYPEDALVQVASFYQGSNLIIGTKRRIAGLSLRATDLTWTHGSGPEVAGPMIALVMAMTGRKAAADQLSGDGVQQLISRN